jgi:2-oxoglutarate dehydrogenase E1 component
VVNCTTPAQYFHVLRRQMRRSFRSPLVIFTPKSLLRLPRAASRPAELAQGSFQPVLDDSQTAADAASVRRVVLSSGKLYYELLTERERRFEGDPGGVALVRVEQLYPWPEARIAAVIGRYERAQTVVWAQEEPANMGAWSFVRDRLIPPLAGRALHYAGRPESASPATGSLRIHRTEQSELIAAAFAGLD